MKVNYINEGYFKNPEQARVARANKEDNKVAIAKLATKLLAKSLSDLLTEAIDINESDEGWYEGTVLNSLAFDQLFLAFTFTEHTLHGMIKPEAVASIQSDGTIYIDFYIRINSNKIFSHFTDDKIEDVGKFTALVTWNPSYALNAFGPMSMMNPKMKKRLGLPEKLKKRVADMRWVKSSKDENLKAAWQLFIHTPTVKIKINKIHMFGECVGDLYLSAMEDFSDTKDSIAVLNEFFSFENKGNVYLLRRIFSWDSNYLGGGETGREYKIYKIEGDTLKDYDYIQQ